MKRLILLLLFLFGITLENYAQRITTINEYVSAEISFTNELLSAEPTISNEEFRERLRQFNFDNFPKVLNETSNAPHQQRAMAANLGFDAVPDSLERIALEAFYNSTGGANWLKNTNWLQGLTNADFATWHGVTVLNGDVTKISMGANNLKGPLPKEIGLLSNLEYLILYHNDINGALPIELGQLKNLVNLNLQGNEVGGQVPPEIGDMTNLVRLSLNVNNLSGSIPASLGRLSNLNHLDLGYNYMYGNLPAELGDLHNLGYLLLSGNNFVGQLPSELGKLTNLRTLTLTSNHLNSIAPSLWGQLANLVILSIARNDLQGPIPNSLAQLSNVTILDLSYNELTGAIPGDLCSLEKIERLVLSYNHLEGPLPTCIGDLTTLKYLNASHNNLTGAVPSQIKTLPQLTDLYLDDNQLTGFPDLSSMANAPNLFVSLPRNQLTFEDIEPNFNSAGASYLRYFGYNFQKEVPLYIDYNTFTFSVEVGGANNRYQWYKNGVAIPGATQSSLRIAPEDFHTENTFYCRITNTVATALTLKSSTEPIEMSTGVFYAVKDGSWHQSGTWSFSPNGKPVVSVPELDDIVYIQDHHIVVNVPTSCKSIEVIVEKNSASLTVDGALMTMNGGELKLTKKEEGYPANVRVVNGGQVKLNKPVEN